MIISVTGAAKGFELDTHRRSIISKGLKHALDHEGVWIVSGGTSTGIMKLVGQVVADQAAVGRPVPAIGIGEYPV